PRAAGAARPPMSPEPCGTSAARPRATSPARPSTSTAARTSADRQPPQNLRSRRRGCHRAAAASRGHRQRMDVYLYEWLNLALRWLHFVAGIAWIGSSFYFVWLDNSLEAPADPALKGKGVAGEL